MRKLVIIFIFFLLIACTPTLKIIEVPIESVRTEYINNIKYDSIHIHDSIDRYIKGDTVFIYKQKTAYKYKYLTDTVIKTDSIQIPVKIKEEVVKEVNVLKGWQSALMYLGIGFLIVIIAILYKLVSKLFKK